MIVTIESLGYQVRAYTKGPCWQLYKWTVPKDSAASAGDWRPIDCYPSTLDHALRLIAERVARESDAVTDLPGAIAEIGRIVGSLTTAVEGRQPAPDRCSDAAA